jgi:glycosyltransferase involved in cell wall biosynthesis
MFKWRERFIHANPGVARSLAAFAPDVVVTTGFNPSHLLAWRFALGRAAHVAMTDGTLDWEARLGWIHRAARRMVYARTRAFVGASDRSLSLYRHYGIASPSLFKSVLCADNAAFATARSAGDFREFDFIFCGQFIARKAPMFAIEVAAGVAARLGRRVRLLMVGSGPLEAEMRRAAAAHAATLDCVLPGFATQRDLPSLYASARVLLFPTLGDAWGVVANEACAAGLPVLVSPLAGVAGELVRDGENGRILELDVKPWIDAASTLISDLPTWRRMSARSHALVAPYSYANAAAGLAAAVGHAAHAADSARNER